MAPLAIYVRVSEVGERGGPGFASPEEQEAAAREWAERAGVDVYFVEDACVDLNVSGAAAVDDRRLGRLIERCESGEFGGIIVRDERRFARDPIAGGVALDRLIEAGGRLKATWSGFDTGPGGRDVTPENRMFFGIMMEIGRAERTRNRLNRVNGNRRAADRGVYLAVRVPTGYVMDTDRRITPDPATRGLIVELFERRAGGESIRSMAAWLRASGVPITKTGVGYMLRNRAYLGEMTVPTERKGELEVRRNAHEPIITEDLWEQAQAAGGPYHPRNGRWASQGRLAGIAVCSGCGRALSVNGGGGKSESRAAYYVCTAEGCQARVGIKAERLDAWADGMLTDCVYADVSEVIRVLDGDDRHARALEAVKLARAELETYVEQVRVSDVGRETWIRGKEARAAALAVAQKELAAIPAPKPISRRQAQKLVTWREAEPALDREWNAKFISRVIVKPVGRGRRVPVGERVEVWLVGAAEPLDLARLRPAAGDPAVTEMLSKALTADEIAALNAEQGAEAA